MGWAPPAVDDTGLWEFGAAAEGWIRANTTGDKPETMTDAEFEDLLRL